MNMRLSNSTFRNKLKVTTISLLLNIGLVTMYLCAFCFSQTLSTFIIVVPLWWQDQEDHFYLILVSFLFSAGIYMENSDNRVFNNEYY